MKERDYYEVLQLHPRADHTIVIQAYWHLARKYKMAIGVDAGAEQRLQELNDAFAVLGSPKERATYDLSRAQRSAVAGQATKKEDAPKKRVTIEVSYWHLPPWQGMLAATGTLTVATLALLAGANLVITLALAAIAMAAALLPVPGDWERLDSKKSEWTSQGEQKLNALELERSTSAIIARWRQETRRHDRLPSLTHLLGGPDQYLRGSTSPESVQHPKDSQ